jgi:phosphatidylglycerophosphatase A
LNFLERLIVTAFYSGYSHFASGTCGTAVALFVYIFLPELSAFVWILGLVILFLVAVRTSTKGEAEWGHDPSPVVIDEVVGFFVSIAFLPQSLLVGVTGFFLFRALDILKPSPAREAESLPGGWGVVLDDVAAGVYANLILRGVIYVAGDALAGHI